MRLFKRSLISLMSVNALTCLIILALALLSYERSSSGWEKTRIKEISEAARFLLREGDENPFRGLGSDVPIFVYDAEGALVASTRGAGRWRSSAAETRLPIEEGGQVLGYLAMGSVSIRENAANRAFLDSMLAALALAAGASLFASLALAFFLARSVSLPAASLSKALAGLAAGNRGAAVIPVGPAELRNIAASAETLRRQLNAEAELRSQWVQDLVHDLRTPVAAMGAQLEALADGVLEPSPERMRRLGSEIGRMGALVESLEELMRLEAPELSARPSDFSLRDAADGLLDRYRARIEAKGLHVGIDLGALSLRADGRQLERALSNVFGNAVEYAPEGARIVLKSYSDASGAVSIEIENSGSRLAPGEEERVFERLYRGEYSRGSGGSGLGLSIARRIVRLHSGELTARNSGDDAVTFRFVFPGLPSPSLHGEHSEP